MISCGDGEARKRVCILKEVTWEVYTLAPLGDDREEGTTSRADEDDKDGSDPQTEVSVNATAIAAVGDLVISSDSVHCLDGGRRRKGMEGGSGERRGI